MQQAVKARAPRRPPRPRHSSSTAAAQRVASSVTGAWPWTCSGGDRIISIRYVSQEHERSARVCVWRSWAPAGCLPMAPPHM
jgi:hypothetical protein